MFWPHFQFDCKCSEDIVTPLHVNDIVTDNCGGNIVIYLVSYRFSARTRYTFRDSFTAGSMSPEPNPSGRLRRTPDIARPNYVTRRYILLSADSTTGSVGEITETTEDI